ncbi:uncharacterized protein TNCV_2413681 [Trichonephila clavipes]|nr:uncharacterized protein TNCV_2413681 [Trichonephila clavipes]
MVPLAAETFVTGVDQAMDVLRIDHSTVNGVEWYSQTQNYALRTQYAVLRKSTHTEKKTATMYVQVLLMSVLTLGSVVDVKGFPDSFVTYLLNANACVSESGNPSLCKKYVGCANILPKPVKYLFNNCKNSIYPKGFGSCKDGDSLLKSEDDKTQFDVCFIKKLSQYKNLDPTEDRAAFKFAKCIERYGGLCLGY